MVLTERPDHKVPRVNRALTVQSAHKVPQGPTVRQDPRAQLVWMEPTALKVRLDHRGPLV